MTFFVVPVKHNAGTDAGIEAYKLQKGCKTTIKNYCKHEKSDH